MKVVSIERYEGYQECDFRWLYELPQHWHLERVKNLTKTQSGTTPKSGAYEYYESGTNFWVRTTDLNNDRLYSSEYKVTDQAVKDYGLKSIPVNSVLLAMYGGMGTIGKNSLLKEKVTINQSVCAVFPNGKRLDAAYFWYYVQYFRPNWEMFADSARKDPNINQEAVKRLWVTIPPLPEQQSIAVYLDSKTAQLDRQIDLLRQKVDHYGELQQALINETVTQGLDKNVKLKDSGVKWIGAVPEHWEIKRVKDVFKESKNKAGTKSFLYKVLSLTLKGVIVRDLESNKGKIPASFDGYQIVQNDNLVFCLFDMDVTPRIVGYVDQEGIITSAYTVVKNKTRISMKYYYYYFLEQNRNQSLLANSKTLRSTLTFDAFSLLSLPQTSYEEQQAIADYLDEKNAHIDCIVDVISAKIDKLKELRKTLINDVVIGKIKVMGRDEAL